jgi:WD40 repeat protein
MSSFGKFTNSLNTFRKQPPAEPLRGHEQRVNSVSSSVDGSHIVSGSCDGTVRVWDAASGEAVGEPLRGHEGCVRFVTFSADGSRIVSAGVDNAVLVWDAASGECIRTIVVVASCWKEEQTLLAMAGLSAARCVGTSCRAKIIVSGGAILQTSKDGGSATRLGTLDTSISGGMWVFDESHRILWWVAYGRSGADRTCRVTA